MPGIEYIWRNKVALLAFWWILNIRRHALEGELWKLRYHRGLDLCNSWDTPGKQHSDAAVVLVYR